MKKLQGDLASNSAVPASPRLGSTRVPAQRYTFEKVGDGYQFTTHTDGLWVMAKDVDCLEWELASAIELRDTWERHAADCQTSLVEISAELAVRDRELAEANDAAARWYTAAVPYATPSALYDALKFVRAAAKDSK